MRLRLPLVVDRPDSAAVTPTVPAEYGHGARVARYEPSALSGCRSKRPDAVLLGIDLPGMSGYDVGNQLCDEFIAAKPTLIAITARIAVPAAISGRPQESPHI